MSRVIVIRYGEIFLKGKNRDYFESLLIKNIKAALSGIDYRFTRTQGRYYAEDFAPEDESEMVERLKKVFGIHSLSVARKVAVMAESDFPETSSARTSACRGRARG